VTVYRVDVHGLDASELEGFFEGWPTAPSSADLLRVLRDSPYRVLALDDDRVVGFVYAVSDGLPAPGGSLGLAALALRQNARAVQDPAELSAAVWDSDEELGAFLADLRASRSASLG